MIPGEMKISSKQLGFLIITVLFGDVAIMNPARSAQNDSWLAFIIGTVMGLLLVTIYIGITKLNPGKNLIEIILDVFGKMIGRIIAVLYIWYFIHLASVVLKAFGEYMIVVSYQESPQIFIKIALLLAIIYALRKGIEVVARTYEILAPLLIIFVILLFFLLIPEYDMNFFKPFLKDGIQPVLKTGLSIATFPFGELIIFLMIFPLLNEEKKLVKTTYVSIIIGSVALLSIVIRDLLTLGPRILGMVYFPPNISTAMLPTVVFQPLIAINLLIGGIAFLSVYIYSIALGISELFSIRESKALLLPIVILVLGISLWLYDHLPEMFRVAEEIYPYYAIPFQIVIPLIILIISYFKNNKNSKKEYNIS